jgi:hypothetical protein
MYLCVYIYSICIYIYIHITILSVIASYVYLSVCTYVYLSMLLMSVCLSVWFLILGNGLIILGSSLYVRQSRASQLVVTVCHCLIKGEKCVI